MTVVDTPPRPQPSQDELEALIEEARRRTRRRRSIIGLAVGMALAAAGLAIALVLALRGGGGPAVPRGYHLVQAKGAVEHARIERSYTGEAQLVDVRTGRSRPVGETLDVWWDAKSGLVRVVLSLAGLRQYDGVGQQCFGKARKAAVGFCDIPVPFGLRQKGFFLPVKPKYRRITGRGTVRGRRVIWVETIAPTGENGVRRPTGERVALDTRTHKPVAQRQHFGAFALKELYTRLPDLKANEFRFVVPNGGAQQHSFPPAGSPVIHGVRKPLAGTLDALGGAPLWLGRSYQGHRLRSVKVGTEGEDAVHGPTLRPVPFVAFDYGIVVLREFGRQRPYWFEDGPPAGKLLARNDDVTLARNGVFVNARWHRARSAGAVARALALAKALRPVG